MWREGKYKNGQKEGQWVWYDDNGKLWTEENYKDGQLNGKWVSHYKDGSVFYGGNYKVGKLNGKWVWYDEDGNTKDEDIWEDGKCVEMCEGDWTETKLLRD